MALFNRSHLFGLLLLASLPLDGAAALALASVQATPVESSISERSIEERLSRIAAAVQEREGSLGAPEGSTGVADDSLSYVFVIGAGLGWANGGFNNGGFYNGGFYNGGFNNGGFYNGGFRNGGFRNGGFLNGGRYWR
jgi:rSAM-associated Gly-rich repeat protein